MGELINSGQFKKSHFWWIFSGWRSEFLTGFEQQTATTPSSFVGCQNFQSVVLSSLNCETREQLWTGIPVYLFLFDFLLTNNTAARHKGNKFVLVVRIYAALIIPLSSSQPKARYRLSTSDKRIEQLNGPCHWSPVTANSLKLLNCYFFQQYRTRPQLSMQELLRFIQSYTRIDDFIRKA